MKYLTDIHQSAAEPKQLEVLFQSARQAGDAEEFSSDLLACYQESPDNVLLAAWYYRLQASPAEPASRPERSTIWRWAVPMALLSGLALGLVFALTDDYLFHLPTFILAWAPVAAILAIAFLALVARQKYTQALAAVGLLVVALLYVLLISPTLPKWLSDAYLDQMAIHLPLLSWIALGIALLWLRSIVKDRFSFLIKSIEAAITAGLYLIAGLAFGLITIGMLNALGIELPDRWMRFLTGGGIGLISIIAIATIYDPRFSPGEQDFSQGLSKFIANMMRLLLPLTLLVLVIYVLIIPFNFMEPFNDRGVLIVYNLMLFAIMGLLLGATPILSDELSPKLKAALRAGMLAVASLAILVSLYAFSAILYRTFQDQLTMNRLIVIGWNLINTVILGMLVYQLWRSKDDIWVGRAQAVFSRGTIGYVVWTLFVIFAIPLLF